MSPAARGKREATPEKMETDGAIRETFATLYTKNVERMADIQKRSIDIAVQQNKEALGLWKQLSERLPWAPPLKGFEETATTLERLAGTQKTALDMMVENTRAFVEMVKERAAATEKTTHSVLNFAKQSFDRTVDAHKKAVDIAVNESKSAIENAREHFDFPGTAALAESIQHGVDSIVEAQKELLETISH
jgi:hypothetical protein